MTLERERELNDSGSCVYIFDQFKIEDKNVEITAILKGNEGEIYQCSVMSDENSWYLERHQIGKDPMMPIKVNKTQAFKMGYVLFKNGVEVHCSKKFHGMTKSYEYGIMEITEVA